MSTTTQRTEWMSPDGRIVLHCGDYLLGLEYICNKTYNLACVDPPYGIRHDGQYKRNTKLVKHRRKKFEFKHCDSVRPQDNYFRSLEQVSENQIIFGGNYFVKHLNPSMGWIVWDKGQRLSMSDGELIYTSFNRALRIIRINRCELAREGTIHPTQKPVKLYEQIFDLYAKPDDFILDTHLGSGSIAIACINKGLRLEA
jgi:site-specific DNA-methyltransferase (adenine-specific)